MTAAETTAAPLLQVRDLQTWFPIKKGLLSRVVGHNKAVDGVSFDVAAGETLGLVGESGCGKTTVGRTILRLIPATGGSVRFDGKEVFELGREELRHLRRDMQIIFQDPYSSLNPRMDIKTIVGEALQVHGLAKGSELEDRVGALLHRVGLQKEYMRRFPHEFSGGQRQRVGIARALALKPRFIVCDEAVSALDVSVQAQVLNLLEELQDQPDPEDPTRKLSFLFIAHDLSVVRHLSDRVAVMYLGEIVEIGTVDQLYEDPRHPYTQALLSAIPVPRPGRKRQRITLQGDVPKPSAPPPGCHFHTRCPKVAELGIAACTQGSSPKAVEVAPGHQVACHWVERELGGK